jgi:O-antigen/teichoic acid export membrane protein
MKDLKRKALHGGLARFCGQVASFALRLVSVVVLARLLSPEEFGLAAMAIIVAGVYELFSASLCSATIQKDTVSDEQASTLFWINVGIGVVLGLLCFATAPLLVAFYNEPRLFWATGALGLGFLFSSLGVQHSGLLARQLRYVILAVIDIVALSASIIVSIGLAWWGAGFWALVAGAITTPAVSSTGMWLASRWIPGPPRRVAGTGSLLLFGGTMTLNGVVIYVAYNIEKVLLGRFWGAEALGVYGRAYQLINFPTTIINASVGSVAFAALSRLQDDPATYKRYFLKGYALVNSVTMPTTLLCAVFAEEVIQILLGPKWSAAVPIFQLLAPTVLVFGLINPMAWLLFSLGYQKRSLALALVISPIVIIAYLVGLPYGPTGVALAYSTAMTLWLVPHILWCLRGTLISPSELVVAISPPLLSALAAAAVGFLVDRLLDSLHASLATAALAATIMCATYVVVLFYAFGQKALFFDVLRDLRGRAAPAAG